MDWQNGRLTSEETPPISTVTFQSQRGAQAQFPIELHTLTASMANQKMGRAQGIVDELAAATTMRFGGAMTYAENQIICLKTKLTLTLQSKHSKKLDSYSQIGDGAVSLIHNCWHTPTEAFGGGVAGQAFYADDWNIIVQKDNC